MMKIIMLFPLWSGVLDGTTVPYSCVPYSCATVWYSGTIQRKILQLYGTVVPSNREAPFSHLELHYFG